MFVKNHPTRNNFLSEIKICLVLLTDSSNLHENDSKQSVEGCTEVLHNTIQN